MRVLDIDLDFFLDNIARDRNDLGDRLREDEFCPWTSDKVREFLEDRCGLSTSKRIPGKCITHHHEAFYWWRELIKAQRLITPFEIVHIDAHADLGAGTLSFSPSFVCYDLLHRPLEQRQNPAEGGMYLNAGNYLLIAIACQWVQKLVYVAHPQNRFEDCESWLFSDCKDESWTIALPRCQKPKEFVPGVNPRVLGREPDVEFIPTFGSTYKDNGSFDFIVLCQSPAFTPSSADLLIPVIQEYMDLTIEI